jgi:hypothetical protein
MYFISHDNIFQEWKENKDISWQIQAKLIYF